MTLTDLSADQLRRAADIKETIQSLQQELNRIFDNTTVETTSWKPRTMSASARRKIAAAQRARWAKFHAGKS